MGQDRLRRSGCPVAALGSAPGTQARCRRAQTSFATRTIVPLVLGLGGWLGAALVVLTLWPALSLTSEVLGILAVSVPIALGLYLAWTHRDWDRGTKSLGLLAATAGALLGGWLGFTATSGLFAIVTTTIGAAAAGKLALIALASSANGPRARPWQRPRRNLRSPEALPTGSKVSPMIS